MTKVFPYKIFGLSNLDVTGIDSYVDDEGEVCYTIPASLNKTIITEVIHKNGSLNGEECKKLRKSLHKTQQELADSFNVNVRTVRRWESGDQQIDNANDLRLRFLVAKHKLSMGIALDIMDKYADKVLHPKEVTYHIDITDQKTAHA